MASIDLSNPLRKHTKQTKTYKHKRRLGIRIDMTPMVDVAFLLLTFFMLSTSLSRHQIMAIAVPRLEPSPYPENSLLTIRVNDNNFIFWNIGNDIPIRISLNGLKNLLTLKSKQDPLLITLLKIDRKARYHSIIDVLDNLQLSGASRYSIAPMAEIDREILRTIPS